MRVIAAHHYFVLDGGYSSSDVTVPSGAKIPIYASQAAVIPYDVYSDVQVRTSRYSGSYSGFYNLNNVDHFKVYGTIIATPVADTVMLPVSTCGPIHRIGSHTYCDAISVFGSDTSIATTLFGSIANSQSALWHFASATFWHTPTRIAFVHGYPDSDVAYGAYSVTLSEVIVSSKTYEFRRVSTTTKLRTSTASPKEAWLSVRDSLLSQLSLTTLNTYEITNANLIVGQTMGEMPNFNLNIDPHQVFPGIDIPWHQMAAKAYSSVSLFSGNGIAFAKDLVEMKKQATSTLTLIKALGGTKGKLAIIANLYLAFHYGWKLFASDCKNLNEAYRRYMSLTSSHSKCSSHYEWTLGDIRYKAYYHCYYDRYGQVSSALERLSSLFDLDLSLGNTWDLIPFSFVIDWFVNVSDCLEAIDANYIMTQRHKITCTGRSVKCTRMAQGPRGFAGSVYYSWYTRYYTRDIVSPTLSLELNSNPLNHFIEGTALIVSKR